MDRAVVSADGRLRMGDHHFRVAVGRAGITADKREGDGATPCGVLRLRRVLYRADRLGSPPRTVLPREPITPKDGWCDDPASVDYNRPVSRPYPAGHEHLWRGDGLYDVIGVLGWNDDPVERGRGSAIFLHVAAPHLEPTEGCVAMALSDLLAVLADGLTELHILPP